MNMSGVAQAAYAAGVRDPSDLGRAVAVAFAESGGNPRAHNAVPPDDSYGLWQINMLGSLGPSRRQQFGISSNDALYDPAVNAKAMVAISGGGKNWKPWTTYGGLRYLAFLPAANAAAAAVAGTGGSSLPGAVEGAAEGAITGPGNPIGDWTDAVKATGGAVVKAGEWATDRNNWFRVAKVLAGGGLLLVGLNMLARPYATKAIAPIVGAVAPVGKAAKAVGGIAKS